MNGASPVPERKISTAKSTNTTMIGRSHHFLLRFKKPQRSRRMPPRTPCSAAAFSNSLCLESFIGFAFGSETIASILMKIRARILGRFLVDPVTGLLGVRFPVERVPTHDPEQQGHRRNDAVKHQGQHDLCDHPANRECQ